MASTAERLHDLVGRFSTGRGSLLPPAPSGDGREGLAPVGEVDEHESAPVSVG